MSAKIWRPLLAELDLWHATGRSLHLWLRDDDAAEPTEQLEHLIAFARRFRAPILLAVIPLKANAALADRLRDEPLLRPCQHGAAHRNHALPGEPAAEVGPQRPLDVVTAELAQARDRLRELFGANMLDIFVPPWNRIDPRVAASLPSLGFTGLSTFRSPLPLPPIPGLRVQNPDLDLIDWKAGTIGRPHDWLIRELLILLSQKRLAGERDATLGLLLHHLAHDETAWRFLDLFFEKVAGHPALKVSEWRVDEGRVANSE